MHAQRSYCFEESKLMQTSDRNVNSQCFYPTLKSVKTFSSNIVFQQPWESISLEKRLGVYFICSRAAWQQCCQLKRIWREARKMWGHIHPKFTFSVYFENLQLIFGFGFLFGGGAFVFCSWCSPCSLLISRPSFTLGAKFPAKEETLGPLHLSVLLQARWWLRLALQLPMEFTEPRERLILVHDGVKEQYEISPCQWVGI